MAHILVVDDNIVSLKQIRILLGGSHDIALAKSGAMALQICAQERPDLILLDIDMPEMDGFETIAKLKSSIYTNNIPVIFLTGNNDAETEIHGLAAGAIDFITKPAEQSLLQHRIDLHLRFSAYQKYLERSVQELSDSVAVSFSELIECRDKSTGEHVTRTGQYVRKLGEYLKEQGCFHDELTDDSLEMMARGAPLHDIGKIGISDAILLKPDRLTDEEFATMKHHSVIGAEILENMFLRTPSLSYLGYAKMIAVSHHERYDGKGYPYALAGEDIPLCGRIMAVADVYDALVEERVYRRKLSHAEALLIILEGKGTQFDPKVVDAFHVLYGKSV